MGSWAAAGRPAQSVTLLDGMNAVIGEKGKVIYARGANITAIVMSAISMVGVTDHYDRRKAMRHLDAKEVVIFAAGTGNPFFTTDSAACLRGIEINADVVLKATKVDGVYTADPFKDPHAEKFDHLTYDEVLDRKLGVMDLTAICLCRDHKMPLRVFNMNKPGALLNIVHGGAEGTLIEEIEQ